MPGGRFDLLATGALLAAVAYALGRIRGGCSAKAPGCSDPRGLRPRSAAETAGPAGEREEAADDGARRQQLRSQAEMLPCVRSLRSEGGRYAEREPYRPVEAEGAAAISRHFTAGTLAGDGKLGMWPLVFEEDGGKRSRTVLHVGRRLCGHDGIVHGGLIATLFDEALARIAFQVVPGKVCFTANLNVNYRQPLKADSFYVITSELEKTEGRKAWVKATLSDAIGSDSPVLADATALFVAPRQPPSASAPSS